MDIEYSNTCIELWLPMTLWCDGCKAIKEDKYGFLKKSSHKSEWFRETSERRCCQQPWTSEHGKSTKHIATNRMFARIRYYMNIDCDIEIKSIYAYDNTNKRQKMNDPKSIRVIQPNPDHHNDTISAPLPVLTPI